MNSASKDQSNRIDDLIDTFLNDSKCSKHENPEVLQSMSDDFFDDINFPIKSDNAMFVHSPYIKSKVIHSTQNYTMQESEIKCNTTNEIKPPSNISYEQVGSFINSSQTYDSAMYNTNYIPKNAQSLFNGELYLNTKKKKTFFSGVNDINHHWNGQNISPIKCNNGYGDTLIPMFGYQYDNSSVVPNLIAVDSLPINSSYDNTQERQPREPRNFYLKQNSNFVKSNNDNMSPMLSMNDAQNKNLNVYNNIRMEETNNSYNLINSPDRSSGDISGVSPVHYEHKYKKGKRTISHNVIEKRYRMSINDKILELKQILTTECDSRLSKASILKMAIAKIKKLQSINRELNLENKKLKQIIYSNTNSKSNLNNDNLKNAFKKEGCFSESPSFLSSTNDDTEEIECTYPESPIKRPEPRNNNDYMHPRTNVYAFILLCALFSFNPCSLITSTLSWYPIFGKIETKSFQITPNIHSRLLFSMNTNPGQDALLIDKSSTFSMFYMIILWILGWMINFVVMMFLFKCFFFLPRQRLLSESDLSMDAKLKKRGPSWNKEEWDQLHYNFDFLSKNLTFFQRENIIKFHKKHDQKNISESESCNKDINNENIRNETLRNIMTYLGQYDTIKFVENIGFFRIFFALFIQIIFYIFNFFLNPYIMMNRVFTIHDYMKIASLYDRMVQICFHEICTTKPKNRRKHLNIIALYFAFSSLNAVKNVKTKNYLDQKIGIYFNTSIICRLVCPGWTKKIMHRYFCRRAMRLYFKLNKAHDTFHWLKHPLGNKFFFSDEGEVELRNSFNIHDINLSRRQFTLNPLIIFKHHFVSWLFKKALISTPTNCEYPTATNFPRAEDTLTPLKYLRCIKHICIRKDDYEIVELWWCSYIELATRWPFCDNERMKRMTYIYKYVQKTKGDESLQPIMKVSILLYFCGQIVINYDEANLNRLLSCIMSIREQLYGIVAKPSTFSDTYTIILYKFFDWLITCEFKALSTYRNYNDVHVFNVAKNIETDIGILSTICLHLPQIIKSSSESKIKLHKTMLLILKRVNPVILFDQVKWVDRYEKQKIAQSCILVSFLSQYSKCQPDSYISSYLCSLKQTISSILSVK
ncbi:hypothetical protein A3Q56_03607 [Intoshia linei]|uniref:BHLH domain-containing protein n=1 Tax=Intoshia linei TaxID=1819745 RepID=A0A177B2Z5_9BILA|nr:hypothetical protein A3Q56_03607 [Intoshia linei]